MEEQINFELKIENYFLSVIKTLKLIDKKELSLSVNALLSAYFRGANVYCFGNGGSASTASHMLNDFNKGVSLNLRRKFNFCCLNDNVAMMTALANDIGYPFIFVKQLEGKLRSGDLIIAISGSGNSANVIHAVEYAKSVDCRVLGVTGYDGGKLNQLSDYHMHVPIFDMQVVEDIHMIFNHMMMKIFCQELGALNECC